MTKKIIKWNSVLLLSMVAIFLTTTVIRNVAFKTCPLSNNMTIEELQEMDLYVDYIENSESWDSEIYKSFCNEQILGSEECSCILVGTPTGNIYFNRGTILQELYVEKVISGKCEYEKIWLQNGLKSTIEWNENAVVIKGMDRSFMQENCKYLLFCDPSAANKYADKKVYTEADGMWFGCYNLTRDSNIVTGHYQNKYNPQIEFYTSSEKILVCYNEAKRQLIERYCN